LRNLDSSAIRRLVLATAPVNPLPAKISPIERIQHLVQDPAYWLKA